TFVELTRPRCARSARSVPAAEIAVTFDTWESYFYPETIDPVTGVGTLRNILGEHDGAALARREYVRTSARAEQLLRGEVPIPKTYDGEHLRAIHWYLFQDVYSWAGEYRTVNIFKGTPRGLLISPLVRSTVTCPRCTSWSPVSSGRDWTMRSLPTGSPGCSP